MLFAVRLVDLSAIKALDLTRASNAEIGERLRQVFDFLPKETRIEVADGIVTIDIPDSAIQDKSEADRLHVRATQRAKQGDYRKAVGIWERVIELDPANVEARRNLGMAYVELLETDIVNPGDKFELVFRNLLETLFVERMDQNEEIFIRFMNDPTFQKVVTKWLASEAYQKLRSRVTT